MVFVYKWEILSVIYLVWSQRLVILDSHPSNQQSFDCNLTTSQTPDHWIVSRMHYTTKPSFNNWRHNRLTVPLVKLTTVVNWPGFPELQPNRHLPSVSDWKLTCLPNPFSDYSLHWTSPNLSLYGPSGSLYYLGHFKNPGLTDWLSTYVCVVWRDLTSVRNERALTAEDSRLMM